MAEYLKNLAVIVGMKTAQFSAVSADKIHDLIIGEQFDPTGLAFIRTCKAVRIPCTRTDIVAFVA